jgi:long-chain-fatty-acid--[acyl-carrier-protein] ligase
MEASYATDEDEGPTLAVVATPDEERPEIVLFTTRNVDRGAANRTIRDAGLSGLYNIRRVIQVDQLPLLGTGKVDYRALTERLRSEAR